MTQRRRQCHGRTRSDGLGVWAAGSGWRATRHERSDAVLLVIVIVINL